MTGDVYPLFLKRESKWLRLRNITKKTKKKPIMLNKFIILIISLFISYGLAIGQGTWNQKANFPGTGRDYPAAFSIGTKGYCGTGEENNGLTNDFWEYNPSTDIWTQKANFPGSKRWCACGFSIGNKGYIGLGHDSTHSCLKDFWEYDPNTNIWTQRADFGGGKRAIAACFTINNKGYICTGFDTLGFADNELWEYDPITDIWTQKAVFPGTPRSESISFSISNKGYVGTGFSNSGYLDDFWEWDQSSNVWTQKANFIGGKICDAAGFSICSRGYICTGEKPPTGIFTNELWEYIPDSNIWIQKSNFGGSIRDETVAITINNKGYVGFGANFETYYNDFWEYTPDTLCNDSLVPLPSEISDILYVPNIFSPNNDGNNDVLYVQGENIKELTFSIYNRWGDKVFECRDKNIGWNGKYENKDCEIGVYVYVANITFSNGKPLFKKGNVTLVR